MGASKDLTMKPRRVALASCGESRRVIGLRLKNTRELTSCLLPRLRHASDASEFLRTCQTPRRSPRVPEEPIVARRARRAWRRWTGRELRGAAHATRDAAIYLPRIPGPRPGRGRSPAFSLSEFAALKQISSGPRPTPFAALPALLHSPASSVSNGRHRPSEESRGPGVLPC